MWQGRADHAVERPAAGILEHQRHRPPSWRSSSGTGGPGWVELGAQGIFMLQPLEDGSRRMAHEPA